MNIRHEIIDAVESSCETLNQNCIDEEFKYQYLEIIMLYIQSSSLKELNEIYVILSNNITISNNNRNYFEQLKKAVSCFRKLKNAGFNTPTDLPKDNPSQFYKEILKYCKYYDI